MIKYVPYRYAEHKEYMDRRIRIQIFTKPTTGISIIIMDCEVRVYIRKIYLFVFEFTVIES